MYKIPPNLHYIFFSIPAKQHKLMFLPRFFIFVIVSDISNKTQMSYR